ncbi:hypothetical protein ACF0H5_021871 [Mactra antiquata]
MCLWKAEIFCLEGIMNAIRLNPKYLPSGGILIDDDGIVRDDFDLLSKHGSSTHWTDSGLGGDKQSSTPSTLRQLDLQSYPSFDDVSRNLDESNVNISDLEASKDDLSFDADFNDTREGDRGRVTPKGDRSGLSSRSSFDHSLNYDATFDGDDKGIDSGKQDLFGEEYYKQLQELGVLVDEDDFANPRDSLQEFENLETNYSRDYDDNDATHDEIEEFLAKDVTSNVRDSMDIEGPDRNVKQSNDDAGLYDTQGFNVFESHEFGDINEGGKRTRPNTASSTRTISSRSFPEISPEEALELYTERLQSLEHDQDTLSIPFDESQSQRTDTNVVYENDDEIFFVASQETDADSPKPAKILAYDNENVPSMTPKKRGKKSGHSSDDSRTDTPQGRNHSYHDSDGSRSVTPQADLINQENTGYHSNDERIDSLTQVTRLDSRNKTHSESDTFRPDSALSELSSAASESRSARMNKSHGKPPVQQKAGLSHAKSQESFFESDGGNFKKVEKGPKRLLPKPSAAEENQSLKMKSKSAINLAAVTGPVKPTHMSLSEIRNIYDGMDDPELEFNEFDKSEPKSSASDVPKGELTKKLKQESSRRQQATQLVKQLQSDYDKLLSKYALAELTIDQMRLGAKISIHANSPTPSQATSGSLQSAQHLHMLQLTGAQRGSITSASPQQATPNAFFPVNKHGTMYGARLTLQIFGLELRNIKHLYKIDEVSERTCSLYDEDCKTPIQDGSESRVTMSQQRGTSPALLPRSDSTNSMDSTSTPRGDIEEPGGVADDAEKVKLGLMFQSRNLDERMQSFQTLLAEGQLNVEEQETVFDKIRTDHEKLRRDYLQSKEDYNVLRRSTPAGLDVAFDQEKELEGELFKLGMKFDEIHEKVEENLKEKSAKRQPFQKPKQNTEASADDSMEIDPSTENMKKRIQGVNAGNDLLEPRRNSDLDKKLKHLHDEYNTLMDRYRRLKQMAKTPEREQEIDQLVKKLRTISNEEPDIFKLPQELEPGWERSKEPQDVRRSMSRSQENLSSRSRENLNLSMASNRSYRNDDEGDSRYDVPDSRLRRKDRSGSYSSLSSRGRHTPDFSSHDRDSPVPSLPRPRRHDYPDRERRDLKKKSEGGSTTSLPDSGISEHESGAVGGNSGPGSPLSKLPGPGKFKQMTGRRELDTDSGFIGSMVGSEVSAGNLSSRRQPQQSPLRLRHPDSPGRPSSRQSNRSDDSARATTPRSARSVASSKSSRRTPTKAFPLPDSKQTENEARAKTPTKEERKSSSRPSSRTKTRDQQTSRDYTDDSYTSVTESDMSFDSEMRHRRSKRPSSGHNTSQRQIDKIMEDTEEETYSIDPTLNETTDLNLSWITSDSEHPSIRQSRRQDVQKTAKKSEGSVKSDTRVKQPVTKGQEQPRGQGQGRRQEVRRGREVTDESNTSTLSRTDATQDLTQDTTQDTYTSDETTPRSVIERERKQAKQKQQQQQQSRPKDETQAKTVQSAQMEVSPPQRNVTPVKAARSEMHPKKLLDSTLESNPSPDAQLRSYRANKGRQYMDRSIGSRSEETILASDAETAATAATRDSVNSARLKLLTDEIGKLREEFYRANQDKVQQQQPPQVPPPPPPQQQQPDYYDQYFDPTEDPLAFMRGPRRRANSFSGHGGRDWGYDWSLPNVNRDGDIPLGYAAADAYATPRHKSKQDDRPEEESRTRGRNRLRRRINQRNTGTQHYSEQNGYDSDQSPTRVQRDDVQTSPNKVQGHYGYCSQQQQPSTSPGPQNTQNQMRSQAPLQPGRRVFGSQPNLAFSGYQPPPPPPHSTASGSTKSSTRASPGTRPLRQTLYSYAANPTQNRSGYHQSPNQGYQHLPHRQYASDDINVNDGQTRFLPHGGASDINSVQSEGGVYTSACPMCGSTGYHSHGDFVFPPEDNSVPLGYIVHDGSGRPRTRARSKSWGRNGRIRHYSPDGRVRSRYFVREFGNESESAESDTEEFTRRRSRSVGRRRIRHGRKYRRVKGDNDYESDRGTTSSFKTSELQSDLDTYKDSKGDNPVNVNEEMQSRIITYYQSLSNLDRIDSAAGEDDLNRSLRLVGEIDELTNKMMDTVSGELAKSRRRKDFGSSVW